MFNPDLNSRQVSKHYDGFELAATLEAGPEGVAQWTGVLMEADGFRAQEFVFSQRDPRPVLASSRRPGSVLPLEVGNFARFCVEVEQQHV